MPTAASRYPALGGHCACTLRIAAAKPHILEDAADIFSALVIHHHRLFELTFETDLRLAASSLEMDVPPVLKTLSRHDGGSG